MSAFWGVLGKILTCKGVSSPADFRHETFSLAVKPYFRKKPTLKHMQEMHDCLCKHKFYPTRGEVWELHWALTRYKKYKGMSMKKHMNAIYPVAKDVPPHCYPVLGLMAIDQNFRMACFELRKDLDALLEFLNRKRGQVIPTGNKIWGPGFNLPDKKGLSEISKVLSNSKAYASLEGVEAIGWIQPSAKKALQASYGPNACATGFVQLPEKAWKLPKGAPNHYSPYVARAEDLANALLQISAERVGFSEALGTSDRNMGRRDEKEDVKDLQSRIDELRRKDSQKYREVLESFALILESSEKYDKGASRR